jgi:iron complex outermembrane receptor protein
MPTSIGLRSLVLLFAVLVPLAPAAIAAQGSITGVVRTSQQAPAKGVPVTLVELRRHALTDDAGTFKFPDIPPGRYIIAASSPRFGSAVVNAVVADDQETKLTIDLEIEVHTEQVFVSAGADASRLSESARPVTILDDRELQRRLQPTLGETLASEPGVSATSYAPGTSRPVIRGFGGDRVRILESGLGVGDASMPRTSPRTMPCLSIP